MWTRAVLAALFLSLAAPSAAQRLPLTAVHEHYDLAFDVQLAEARFDGVETIRVRVPAETTSIVLHALDIVFREVTVAGQTATVSTSPEMQLAHFTVDRPIPVPCVAAADIPIEPSKIGDQLNGQAQHDLDLVAASAIDLRVALQVALTLLGGCRAG